MTAELRRAWRLRRHPEGEAFEDALALAQEPMPEPAEGEVLYRNQHLSLDAGTRMWMSPRTDGYQPPLPLGVIVPGLALGRVVRSRHADFVPGDLVRGFGQWSDYSCVIPAMADLRKLDDALADPRQHLGVLGMNAWTAYVGITEAGRARPGEAVLVSAAAGATGLLAAQIAKIMGCRVIGLAGGAAKQGYLIDQIGLDAAIDYKAEDVAARLAALGGLDVYFDNVGGPLLDAVLPNMNHYGRVALCGLVAGYGDAAGAPGPARFDQILMRRLTVTGFFSPDFAARGESINRIMRRWHDEGRVQMPFDVTHGLENVLVAYRKLFTGGNIGKVIVTL